MAEERNVASDISREIRQVYAEWLTNHKASQPTNSKGNHSPAVTYDGTGNLSPHCAVHILQLQIHLAFDCEGFSLTLWKICTQEDKFHISTIIHRDKLLDADGILILYPGSDDCNAPFIVLGVISHINSSLKTTLHRKVRHGSEIVAICHEKYIFCILI